MCSHFYGCFPVILENFSQEVLGKESSNFYVSCYPLSCSETVTSRPADWWNPLEYTLYSLHIWENRILLAMA